MRELTFKQESFCNAFVDNGGAVREAYITAYGKGNATDKTIMEQASRLRNDGRINARIKAIMDERAKASVISRQHLTRRLWEQYNFQVGRLFKRTSEGYYVPKDFSELTADEQAMVQGWDKNGNPILVDKMQAIKLLADINGLKSQNKVEISVGGKLGQLLGGGAKQIEGEDIDPDYATL